MLEIFEKVGDINFRQLMDVYEEWNVVNGRGMFPQKPPNLQIILAEQDFYYFLVDFFEKYSGRYFVWAQEGRYVAAVRLEPYKDGLLLEALETAPAVRRRGYAAALMNAVLRYSSEKGYGSIYSHVAKTNDLSLRVHFSSGFSIIADEAEFIDGSFQPDYYTLCYHT